MGGSSLLAVFDAARWTRPIARAADPFFVRTKPSNKRLESMERPERDATLKESDVGCGKESDTRRLWEAEVV